MMYQDEFSRLKKIYDGMPRPKREMVGPIIALPLVAMGVFGFVLLPFGFISLLAVLCIGVFAAAISAFMIVKMVDLRAEIAQWRRFGQASHGPLPGEAAFRLLAAANDPGHEEGAEPVQKTGIQA